MSSSKRKKERRRMRYERNVRKEQEYEDYYYKATQVLTKAPWSFHKEKVRE